jgi:hypothetical protein
VPGGLLEPRGGRGGQNHRDVVRVLGDEAGKGLQPGGIDGLCARLEAEDDPLARMVGGPGDAGVAASRGVGRDLDGRDRVPDGE